MGLLCDKGGKTTKLALNFINTKHPNSAAYLQLICIYEGDDSLENLPRGLGQFVEEINGVSPSYLPVWHFALLSFYVYSASVLEVAVSRWDQKAGPDFLSWRHNVH